MNRRTFAGLTLWLGCLGSLPAEAEQALRILNWKSYIDPEVIASFEREAGVRIEYDTYTTAEQLEQALESGPGYDLVVPSHFQLAHLIEAGRLQPLDTGKLTRYENLDLNLVASLSAFGNANRYVVSYLWTTVGLVVDPAAVEQALGQAVPNSWSLLFHAEHNRKLAGCGVGWLDAPEELFSLRLNYQGKKLSVVSTRFIGKIAETLQEARGRVRSINNEA